MDRSGQLFGQQSVNPPLATETCLTNKAWRLDDQGKMALAALSRAGMTRVKRRIISDFEANGLQRSGQFFAYPISYDAHCANLQFLNENGSTPYFAP